MSSAGVRILERRRERDKGLRLVLTSLHALGPEEYTIRTVKGEVEVQRKPWFFNPATGMYEVRTVQPVLMDASISEKVYSQYEYYRYGLDSKDRIVLLLGLLGQSYPTTAISAAADIAETTTGRLLSELTSEEIVANVRPPVGLGPSVVYDGRPYREGRIGELGRVLTDKGYERFKRLIARRRPIGEVEPPVTVPTYEPLFIELVGRQGRMFVERPIEVTPMTPDEAEYYAEKIRPYYWIGKGLTAEQRRRATYRRLEEEEEERARALGEPSRISLEWLPERRIAKREPTPLAKRKR